MKFLRCEREKMSWEEKLGRYWEAGGRAFDPSPTTQMSLGMTD
jgi:hypothetical protein